MLDLWTRQLKDAILAPFVSLFSYVHPNTLTLASLVVGFLCAWFASVGQQRLALVAWGVNRILDGLDGTVARKTGRTSDFGGYLDIVVDFTVYSLIPLGIAVGEPSTQRFVLVIVLEATYFVNAGGLFQLSAILEKRGMAKKELTTVNMPPGLVEGTETVVMYSLWFIFPAHVDLLFAVFAAAVCVTIVQRVWWAFNNL